MAKVFLCELVILALLIGCRTSAPEAEPHGYGEEISSGDMAVVDCAKGDCRFDWETEMQSGMTRCIGMYVPYEYVDEFLQGCPGGDQELVRIAMPDGDDVVITAANFERVRAAARLYDGSWQP